MSNIDEQNYNLDALIEALQIFRKYENRMYPTHCEHDKFTVLINPREVTEEDIAKLEELGFYEEAGENCFISSRFGSA